MPHLQQHECSSLFETCTLRSSASLCLSVLQRRNPLPVRPVPSPLLNLHCQRPGAGASAATLLARATILTIANSDSVAGSFSSCNQRRATSSWTSHAGWAPGLTSAALACHHSHALVAPVLYHPSADVWGTCAVSDHGSHGRPTDLQPGPALVRARVALSLQLSTTCYSVIRISA
jgi:hypothetical protein